MENTMLLQNEQVNKIVIALRYIESSKMPIGLAWKVKMALQTFEPIAAAYSALATTIRDKYVLRRENGDIVLGTDEHGKDVPGTFQVPIEVSEAFQVEMKELGSQATSFVVENFQLKVSEFPESFEISPVLLNYLTPILTP